MSISEKTISLEEILKKAKAKPQFKFKEIEAVSALVKVVSFEGEDYEFAQINEPYFHHIGQDCEITKKFDSVFWELISEQNSYPFKGVGEHITSF